MRSGPIFYGEGVNISPDGSSNTGAMVLFDTAEKLSIELHCSDATEVVTKL